MSIIDIVWMCKIYQQWTQRLLHPADLLAWPSFDAGVIG